MSSSGQPTCKKACKTSTNWISLAQAEADVAAAQCAEVRSYDGSGNNIANPTWGAVGQQLLRKAPTAYADGFASPAQRGALNPNVRKISNAVVKNVSGAAIKSAQLLSDMTWIYGQWFDHGRVITPENEEEVDNIAVCVGDEALPLGGIIPFHRSVFDETTGIAPNVPREQINALSSYIDGANLYGPNEERALALRLRDGTGRLKTSFGCGGALPPYNTNNLPNASLSHQDAEKMYLCGDVRANENSALLDMHSIWIREHNRLALSLPEMYQTLKGNDELIYQETRRIVVGHMQAIAENEFWPALLGPNGVPAYSGYNALVNAGIANEFSAALYRIGHSMVSGTLRSEAAVSKCGGTDESIVTDVPLDSLYFNTHYLKQHGTDGLLLGASNNVQREIDVHVDEALRTRLFAPHAPGVMLDLAALNMQRGRDHGLPDYNTMRVAYGLAPKASIDEITQNVALRAALRSPDAYGPAAVPSDLDPWIGALAEDHIDSETPVGELMHAGLVDQFTRLRDGDRFWYRNDPALPEWRKNQIANTTLAQIIERNTSLTIGKLFTADIFHVAEEAN